MLRITKRVWDLLPQNSKRREKDGTKKVFFKNTGKSFGGEWIKVFWKN